MRKDPTEFRERFAKWKAGEKVYENGLPKYGDGTTNVIPEDLQGLSDPQFQPQIDAAKVQMTPFVVDDTAYRAQKYHPGTTREQIQQLYNDTPYIGSYNKGMLASPSVGAYFSNRDDYPFIRIGQNKPYEIDQMIAHESGHALEDLLFHGRTQQELDLLNKAYGGIPGTKYNEFGQVNRELRHLISKNNNNAIGKDLDDVITNMKDKDLLWLLKNSNLGYTKSAGQTPNLDASAIKELYWMLHKTNIRLIEETVLCQLRMVNLQDCLRMAGVNLPRREAITCLEKRFVENQMCRTTTLLMIIEEQISQDMNQTRPDICQAETGLPEGT